MVHGPDGVAAIESRGAGLEPQFLYGAEWLWHRYRGVVQHGIGNGDPSATAGIAQMGPSGDPIVLPTPSLQTNFSPTSLAFWQEVYRGDGGDPGGGGTDSRSSIRRSAVVVFSE